MSRRPGACAVAMGALLAAGAIHVAARQAEGPTFTTRVDTVRVDVLARDDGRPVTDLTAADFEVRDNGTRQTIDLLLAEDAPVQVVLALDVSRSVRGSMLTHLREATRDVLSGLRGDDQAALLTFASLVDVRTPLTGDRATLQASLGLDGGAGNTALVDAAHSALVLGDTGTGRPLVMLFSDGADTASFLEPDEVLDTARRAGAVVYAVTTRRDRPDPFLQDLTRLTGGERFDVESSDELQATFARILDEFRHRYVLSFTPRDVSGAGWHELDVRVRRRGVDVTARRGYLATGP